MKKTKNQTLILSPHIDDEVLGCFTWLKAGTHVLYGGVEDRPDIPSAQRRQELEQASTALGFTTEVLDHTVNRYCGHDLIEVFEQTIDRLKPDTVLIPEPSYNQDHRAFYDAAITATRPHDILHQAATVLLYEQPHSVIWPHGPRADFNYFIPFEIEDKLQAYQYYASQVREHRSPATLTALAKVRGACVNKPYAEAFSVKRYVQG